MMGITDGLSTRSGGKTTAPDCPADLGHVAAEITLSRIRKCRAHDVAVEMLGEEFGGVLVSDCFLAYDLLCLSTQKCLAHLLKTFGEIERSKTWAAVRFSRRVAALLRKAMALKRRRGTLDDHGSAVLRVKVHPVLDRLLAGTYTAPDNARLAKRLQEHLLRSPDHDGVDATNNLAERETRPALIARKLSTCNRTEAGAETHAVLLSVPRSCRRQGRDILQPLVVPLRHVPAMSSRCVRAIAPQPPHHRADGS